MPWSFASTSAYATMTLPYFRKKRRYSVTEPDPEHNVVYLGNVLTTMAKGEDCVAKPLALIWKTYCARARNDMQMKLMVTRSGLKVETKQQGLTEYWAHRITFCVAPSQYPRLFCWVYKHEGKRMKPELRCHAVLCRKASEPPSIALTLHDHLQGALREYRKEKLSRQHTRLCGSIAGYPQPPRRKQLLSPGVNYFRPPLSRAKSAPRLGSIDEVDEVDELDALVMLSPCAEVDDEAVDSGSGSPSGSLRVDLEMGNDIDKLRLGERVERLHVAARDADSLSEESGYHEEKSSLEGDDDDEPDLQVTAF